MFSLFPAPSLALLLQVFSNEGQFKFRFGVRGRSPGQLQRPTGVAVDTNGDIIVADYDNRWVSIFSPEGKFKVSSAVVVPL
jgi:tripartite motif-containing protein 2/3